MVKSNVFYSQPPALLLPLCPWPFCPEFLPPQDARTQPACEDFGLSSELCEEDQYTIHARVYRRFTAKETEWCCIIWRCFHVTVLDSRSYEVLLENDKVVGDLLAPFVLGCVLFCP